MIQNRFKSFNENSYKKRKPSMKDTIISNIGNSFKNFVYKNCLERFKKNTKVLPIYI